MAPQASKTSRTPRGAQKWILDELRSLKAGEQLATQAIAKRISKARGKTFHANSVYNALRNLAKRGEIVAVRKGHDKLYAIGQAIRRPRGRPPGSKNRGAAAPMAASAMPAVEASAAPAGPAMPHKLALGEILVLRVRDGTMVTATNLHGKIVIERHPLP